MIIPSIDIMDGKVVQLEQGNKKVYENQDIEIIAEQYKIFPQVNVIDLDSAMDNGNNRELIKSLCKKMTCNVGGGIRSIETVERMLDLGVERFGVGLESAIKIIEEANSK